MSSTSSDPDLIKVTELLLVPNSFLVAALGTADTNPHRGGCFSPGAGRQPAVVGRRS
jgi:hypothetical protein